MVQVPANQGVGLPQRREGCLTQFTPNVVAQQAKRVSAERTGRLKPSRREFRESRFRSPATGSRALAGYRARFADTICGRPQLPPRDRCLSVSWRFGCWPLAWAVRQQPFAFWSNTDGASFSGVLVNEEEVNPPTTSVGRTRPAGSKLRFWRSGKAPADQPLSRCRMNRRFQQMFAQLGSHGQHLRFAAVSRVRSPPAYRCFRG